MPHWIIDLEHNEVRDASGGHAELRRRQFDVLMHLARRHDRLVTKDELIATNWRGLTVSDDSLTKCISEIRQALGPELRNSLKTLAGRGYMLTGWHADESGRLFSNPGAIKPVPQLPAARPLVGRDDDVAHVVRLLGQARLVTITGSGGVGKTSLAIAAANEVTAGFADGAGFVTLAPLLSGGSVAAAILAALRIATGGDPLAAVLAEVMDKRLLLVLDNCEHVIEDAAAVVSRLLADAPGLRVVATSREPLAIEGEAVFRLRTLDYPSGAERLTAEAALAYPAIELLARRAALVADGFVLADADVPAAVEICRRLDGIPLALVLAAAQLRAMRLGEVAQGLDRRFDLLAGGPRDAGERQRTLRATVQWSVDLLNAEHRELFAQVGVFAAPATAGDIAAVCRIRGEAPAVSHVVSLTEKSLLNRHQSATGPTRYGYFETTRHFALEVLGENPVVRRRHAAHLADVLRRGETELEVTSTDAWRDAWRPYLDDLRAALEWAFSSGGDAALAIELAARGATLFDELSLPAERRSWTERAAALPNAADNPGMMGRLTLWRAMRTSWVVWDDGLARSAAALFAQSGEPLWEGRALAMAAASDGYLGAVEEAWPRFDRAEALLRPFGDTRALSNMLRYKATILIWQQRQREAEAPLREAIRIADTIGYFTGSVRGRATQPEIAFEDGDLRTAIDLTVGELAVVSARGSLSDVQAALSGLAGYQLLGGEVEQAATTLRQAFAVDRRLGDAWATRAHVELTGYYLALRGDLEAAAALSAFVEAANIDSDRQSERYQQVMRMRLPELLAPLTSDLRREAAERGTGWSLEQAAATALEKLPAS